MIYRLVFFLLLTTAVTQAIGQPTTDAQLAAYYFQNEEFDKAALYYSKLYEKQPTDFNYSYLRKSYLALEDFKSAEKLSKNQIKVYDKSPDYPIDLGHTYLLMGEQKKGNKVFDKAIKDMKPNQTFITALARTFASIGQNQRALDAYEGGKKLLKGEYDFNYEIAEVYSEMGNYKGMVEQYMGLLDVSDAYLQNVQNALHRTMGFEVNSEQNQILKTALLKRIQKNPEKKVFSEMLIWVYIQEKNFEGAFRQVKALDNRFSENGARVMAFAELAANNKRFDEAIEAYDFVLKKRSTPYHTKAKLDQLKVYQTKIVEGFSYTAEDLSNLDSKYRQAIGELGVNERTVALLKDYAYLKAYYENDVVGAKKILQDALDVPRMNQELRAECKIALADLMVIDGQIWDAALLYGQVEKEFKYDRLGEIAKFKTAKVYFYSGDFEWSKSQLNVLKGSTSKLIANDAMDLSLLITDNSIIDTSFTALRLFAEADLLTVQNLDSNALLLLDSINAQFAGHSLSDEVMMKRYEIAMKRLQFNTAAHFLKELVLLYPEDILADDALFNLAKLYEYQLNDQTKAQEYYRRIIFDYPASLFVVEARKKFRKMRGDMVN